MSKNDGGLVFPKIEAGEFGKDVFLTMVKQGISRRDWLAGLAMQGFTSTLSAEGEINNELIALDAYKVADALIKEGEK